MNTDALTLELQGPGWLETRKALISEVRRGLGRRPRSLPPWLFYDNYGSELFERITELPEYYLTRIERGLLANAAGSLMAMARGDGSRPLRLLELGSGTASKTVFLLDAAVRLQGEVVYMPVDVSRHALETARDRIAHLLPEVCVEPIVANYISRPLQLESFEGTTLVVYLGSSIGNFSPDEARAMLRTLRSQLRPGDALLLGADLVKDDAVLLAAYDDTQGVTAQFNLNILQRLNRELDADFDPANFRHRAIWNRVASRIEMHLQGTRDQRVRIPPTGLDLCLAAYETIHTENSYKFTREAVRALLEAAGFALEYSWTDADEWYAVTLARLP